MKNIVGTPATGENFFHRESEIRKILEQIENGNNLQIAAPRRVGKTSILHYLKDNKLGGHLYIYVDVERINTENDFYKKILKTLIKSDEFKNSQAISRWLQKGGELLKKVKSVKVMGTSVDFIEPDAIPDYHEELSNFLINIELAPGQKLILLIDEFPQAILNIVESDKNDSKAAKKFLESNRELRLNPEILAKVQFIYTGSIGLNHTVASIDASALINDLNSVEIAPLTASEGRELIQQLLQPKTISIDEASADYLLRKIGWLIPFHIQLAIQEIGELCRTTQRANQNDVDQAFDQMVVSRNNNHFEHYHGRLKSQLKAADLAYALAALQKIATDGSITKAELHDLAVGLGVSDQYRIILELLTYDGYINQENPHHQYQFNSPVLRLWWEKYICK